MFEPLDELEHDISLELEEGEISDSEYTPLERPPMNPVSTITNNEPIEDDPPKILDSSSNSDSSDDEPSRKIKRRVLNIPQPPPPPKKKYDIWCRAIEDEALAETLGSCGVRNEDDEDSRDDRHVESYNYRLKYQFNDDNNRNQRNFDQDETTLNENKGGNQGVKRRLGERVPLPTKRDCQERLILDLKVTEEDSEEAIADDLANKLLERETDLLLRVVQVAGKKVAIQLFERTQEIEKNGGMWISHEHRRRTPGGVYFYLVKNDDNLPEGVIKTIFAEKRKMDSKRMKSLKRERRKKNLKIRNEELKKKLQDELNIISGNSTNAKSSEGDSNPPPSPVSAAEEEQMESG